MSIDDWHLTFSSKIINLTDRQFSWCAECSTVWCTNLVSCNVLEIGLDISLGSSRYYNVKICYGA